ncbi:MAG: ATPase domain-containing protein [Thermoplasmata archaeon]
MKRIQSGIKGLDSILDGGFLSPSVNLILGEPGSGKTSLALQFLSEGARLGEKGVYFSILGEPKLIAYSALSQFSFFNEKIWNELIAYIPIETNFRNSKRFSESSFRHVEETFENIINIVEREKPSRVVIDPLTPITFMAKNEPEYWRTLFGMFIALKAWNSTSLIISETKSDSLIEEYLADSILITGFYTKENEIKKYIFVKKMRAANHDCKYHTLKVDTSGLEIVDFPKEGSRLIS